jgi:hypothetical protein
VDLSRPVVDALAYIVISTFVGPIICLLGYEYFQTSDQCGPRPPIPDHPIGHGQRIDTIAQPESRGADPNAYGDNSDAQMYWVISAGIMLAIGILLLVNLLHKRSRIGKVRLILSGLGVLVMTFGYGITLAAGLQVSCS